MQRPCLGLSFSEPLYYHQLPTRRLPWPILVFWLVGLRALIDEMAFLVTVVTGGLAHVNIFPTRWLVAGRIISSLSLGGADLDGRGGALRPRAAGAAIATIPIATTLLVVPARSLGLSGLRAMRSYGSCLLWAEQKGALVLAVILGRFWGGAVALGAARIYLTDPQRKVQDGLGLSRDSLLNGLVPSVFSTIFLLSLGTDGGP